MPEYNENDLPKDLRQFISSQARVYRVYPQITDRILLELICILSKSQISISFDTLMLGASDVEKLKGYILLACMGFAKDIKHQVQALFEEEK